MEKDCCAKCRYLAVINSEKVYAFCGMLSKLYYTDNTKESCCEYFVLKTGGKDAVHD